MEKWEEFIDTDADLNTVDSIALKILVKLVSKEKLLTKEISDDIIQKSYNIAYMFILKKQKIENEQVI